MLRHPENRTNKRPKISLVGAGPGEPDLISVKGLKALKIADVVLYDALVDPVLLDHVPPHTEKVFVGKRAGKCKFGQDQINQLLVEYALNQGHVVRLKGGDPFVFGRGHEELEYALSHGIDTEIIPGITSPIAVPELQHIPLTKRGINESFWIVTGTLKSGEVSADIELAAQSTATVVILMGMNHLEKITEVFKKHGKANTPVAVIQNGTLPDEQIGLGNISTICKVVQEKALSSPAIIIVGDVVRLHPQYEDGEKSFIHSSPDS